MNSIIQKELTYFEQVFYDYLENKIDDFLKTFLFAKSKRLRPLLGILFLKSLEIDIDENLDNHFILIELIHSASLLHDDVIDNSDVRRNQESINKKYDNSLAVSSGDLLLTIAMALILKNDNSEVQKFYIKNMSKMCHGEIKQFFLKHKLPTLDEYIEKSREKTALLFETSILGGVMISGLKEYFDLSLSFAKNFGIAFQIKNDLQNYLTTKDDYNQGVYTAPVIFGKENGIEKTKVLINNYLDESISAVKILPQNEYTLSIIDIVNNMREKNER